MLLEFLDAVCPYTEGVAANQNIMDILAIAKTVVRILQILVPIALIIWGTVDLGKAVIAGDEKKISEAKKPFIQRIIAAVIVFIIPWLVEFVLGYVSNGEWAACWRDAKSTISGNSFSKDVKDTNKY